MTDLRGFIRNRYLATRILALTLVAACFVLANSAFAAEVNPESINWFEMVKGLLGGLALFLFGLEQMSDALKTALGSNIKVLIGRLTKNRVTAALTGASLTALIQSSSVTTVLVVGLVSAGMMTMNQSVGVIIGSNVGTTITAQIVAFKVEEAALWMVALGFLMIFISKQERIRHYGNILMGLGLIFYGMGLMGEGMFPLRSYPPFLDLMERMDNALLAILVGGVFTALVQSSSATTAIVITMAGQGLISLEAGIALALGANVGTCITAMLATLGKTREALRAATVHVFFNIAGVLIWLPFISILADWVTAISPDYPELEGSARLAAELPRQIANANTVFNFANTVIFIAFTTQIARLVQWLVPARVGEEKEIIRPRYLNDALIQSPPLALQTVRFEVARMGEIIAEMMSDVRIAMVERDRHKLEEVHRRGDQVDMLEAKILQYLTEVRKHELSESDDRQVTLAMKAVDAFGRVGDIIQVELIDLSNRVIDQDIKTTETIDHLLTVLADKLLLSVESTIQAVRERDQVAAEKVLTMRADIDHLLDEALVIQSRSLAKEGRTLDITRIEMELFDILKQIYINFRGVANQVLPEAIRDRS